MATLAIEADVWVEQWHVHVCMPDEIWPILMTHELIAHSPPGVPLDCFLRPEAAMPKPCWRLLKWHITRLYYRVYIW